METVTDFTFLGSKIAVDNDYSHEIKRCLLLGRKVMTNLDRRLKSKGITLLTMVHIVKARLPWWFSGKEATYNAGDVRDTGSISRSGRSPGGGHSNPLQYSCLENPMDRGAWQTKVHRVTESWTQLKWMSTHMIFPGVVYYWELDHKEGWVLKNW